MTEDIITTEPPKEGWYVLTSQTPRDIKTEFAKYHPFGMDAFVPTTHFDIMTGKEKRTEQFIAGHFVFVHGTLSDVQSYISATNNRKHITIYPERLPDGFKNTVPTSVPTEQMNHFINMCSVYANRVHLEDFPAEDLQKGDIVMVTLPDGKEVECVLPVSLNQKNKKQGTNGLIPLFGDTCLNIGNVKISDIKFVRFGSDSYRLYDFMKAFFAFADQTLARLNEHPYDDAITPKDLESALRYLRQCERITDLGNIITAKLNVLRLICYVILKKDKACIDAQYRECHESFKTIHKNKWARKLLVYCHLAAVGKAKGWYDRNEVEEFLGKPYSEIMKPYMGSELRQPITLRFAMDKTIGDDIVTAKDFIDHYTVTAEGIATFSVTIAHIRQAIEEQFPIKLIHSELMLDTSKALKRISPTADILIISTLSVSEQCDSPSLVNDAIAAIGKSFRGAQTLS